MAATAFWYGQFFHTLAVKDIDLDSDTLKVMLMTSSYTPNQDTHEFKSDITNEVSGTGYTATGIALTSVVWTYTAGTNTWKLDADDVTWSASTITARYAAVYSVTSGGSDAARRLIGYIDFGGDNTTNGSDFSISWNAAGIGTLTVA